MSLIRLVATRKENSFNPNYLEDIISTRFQVGLHTSNVARLDPANHVLVWGQPWTITDQIIEFLDAGGRCIFDALWEYHIYDQNVISVISKYKQNIIVLTAGDTKEFFSMPHTISIPEWFWYNESAWYHHRGYNTYRHKLGVKPKKFFMPMRRWSQSRSQLFFQIKNELPNAIWSFVERGISLPGYPADQLEDQRYFNPDWYDQTYFSVVAETEVLSDRLPIVTEKTFKPIAFEHPFIVLGQPGALSRLRSMGFASFPEVFDERYDDETNLEIRVKMVVDQIKNFNPEVLNQASVQDKLMHNRNLFFDKQLVTQKINSQLIQPLYEYLNANC